MAQNTVNKDKRQKLQKAKGKLEEISEAYIIRAHFLNCQRVYIIQLEKTYAVGKMD